MNFTDQSNAQAVVIVAQCCRCIFFGKCTSIGRNFETFQYKNNKITNWNNTIMAGTVDTKTNLILTN